MGCGGCGGSGILSGSLSARKRTRVKGTRVRGYSGSGIIKAPKKAAVEDVVKALQEAKEKLAAIVK